MKRILLLGIVLLAAYGFSKKELKWVAIGDSITYLNDHLNETGNRVTKGYMSRVTGTLPFVHYINKGYNGWTAGRIAENFDSLYVPRADVYTVFLGTNDWWQGRPIGTLKDYETNSGNQTVFGSFRIIIDKLRTTSRKARIILITPMKRADFVYLFDQRNHAWGSYKARKGQTLARVAAAVVAVGRAGHTEVIDLYNDRELAEKDLVHFKRLKNPHTGAYQDYTYPGFQQIPFNPETDAYPYPAAAVDLTYDGLHPSDKGCRIIADRIVTLLKK
ncbi:SGNH/GDSL hydrolase family protein [Niabella aurantiaca]|uniref:SGNH/GDSL hydrolase family protein n=1 Tax=Niabella aurantiaca TaxID=379900 RepID=UPI00037ED951|nr:SGNH/GDSL hydrolase family protein [Niabella aurantiaca]